MLIEDLNGRKRIQNITTATLMTLDDGTVKLHCINDKGVISNLSIIDRLTIYVNPNVDKRKESAETTKRDHS